MLPLRPPPLLLVALVSAVLAGCPGPGLPDPEPPPTELPEGLVLGEQVVCVDPTAGFERLTEDRAGRGVTLEVPEPPVHQCSSFRGGLIAQDLDGDGDVDLAFDRFDRFPALLENDGAGGLIEHPRDELLELSGGRHIMSIAAVDTTGDGLPELFLTGPNLLLQVENLGGFTFGPAQPIYDVPAYPWACFNSMAWGDADGDGDLDVFLPGLLGVPDATWMEADQEDGPWVLGSENLLLLNEEGTFTADATDLRLGSDLSLSFLAAFTDRDGDGDADLLVTSDRANLPWWPEGTFFDNLGPRPDGRPDLVEPTEDRGMPRNVSGMGMATVDFNDDGRIDYCMTDFARQLACFQSDGPDGYVEVGLSVGLAPALPGFPSSGNDADWVPWSLSMIDLDNDGFRDAAVAAGPTSGLGSIADSFQFADQPNAIWRGTGPASFQERTEEADFGDINADYGLVSADLDGDGYRELIVSSWEGPPKIYDNPCGADGWLEIELVGPPENTAGIGARVEARDGDWWHTEELQGVLGIGQEPSRFHLGVGDRDAIAELTIVWPDGTRIEAIDVPTRRVLTVTHPGTGD